MYLKFDTNDRLSTRLYDAKRLKLCSIDFPQLYSNMPAAPLMEFIYHNSYAPLELAVCNKRFYNRFLGTKLSSQGFVLKFEDTKREIRSRKWRKYRQKKKDKTLHRIQKIEHIQMYMNITKNLHLCYLLDIFLFWQLN